MHKKFIGIKGITFFLILSFLNLCLTPFSSANVQPVDIEDHWASKDITSATLEGWAYIEKESFHPDKPATREEVIWMIVGARSLWLLNGILEGFSFDKRGDLSVFTDTPSSFARDRIELAFGNGIIYGYPDRSFKPRADITRAELAVILGSQVDGNPGNLALPFKDKCPKWALGGIRSVWSKGIITGYPDGLFRPEQCVTKAEALVMIKKWKETKCPSPVTVSKEFEELSTLIADSILTQNGGVSQIVYFSEGVPGSDTDLGSFTLYEKNPYQLVLRSYDNVITLNVVKKIISYYYPESGEAVYNEVENCIKTGSGNFKYYDGKYFNVGKRNAGIEIIIGKQGEMWK